jgi:hypothetical protein
MSAIAANDDQILRGLKTEASKWIMKTFPDRMSGVGVDEVEVRNQLNTEADHWVQYNFDQRRQGKEGTTSPDFHLYEERPSTVPDEWKSGTNIPHISDEEC